MRGRALVFLDNGYAELGAVLLRNRNGVWHLKEDPSPWEDPVVTAGLKPGQFSHTQGDWIRLLGWAMMCFCAMILEPANGRERHDRVIKSASVLDGEQSEAAKGL